MKIQDEEIIETISHKNYPPFRQEDWLRTILIIPFFALGVFMMFNNGFSFFSLIIISIGIIYFVQIFLRWKKIIQLEYLLTNKKLLIYNKVNKKIEHSFEFTNFPKMTLRENAYNFGFIIIGEKEPILAVSKSIMGIRGGVNMKDHKIVLENLPNAKEIYNLLKNKTITE